MHFNKNKKIVNRKQRTANSKTDAQRGFTLMELLTVLAIFALLTVISVSSYNSFSNDTVLTNMSYELALSVRETQTYGIAVSNRSEADFNNPFGINFSLTGLDETQVYHLFEDSEEPDNPDFVYSDPGFCLTKGDYCHKPYTLQRGVVIDSLYVKDSSCHSVDDLDIVFDRPNPEPFITGTKGSVYKEQSLAQIELKNSDGRSRYVFVRENGQIYVDSTPECQ